MGVGENGTIDRLQTSHHASQTIFHALPYLVGGWHALKHASGICALEWCMVYTGSFAKDLLEHPRN